MFFLTGNFLIIQNVFIFDKPLVVIIKILYYLFIAFFTHWWFCDICYYDYCYKTSLRNHLL